MRTARASAILLLSIICPAVRGDQSERWAEFTRRVFPELRVNQPLEVRRQAIRKFETEDYAQSARFLIDLILERRTEPVIRKEASTVLEAYTNPESRDALEEAVKNSRGGNRYLLGPYIHQGKPESRTFLLNLVKQASSPGIQALAIDGVALLPPPERVSPHYTAALVGWAEDEETFFGIRLAATRALGGIPQKEVVPVLIRLLADPLVTTVARDALLRLTGREFWTDAEAWRDWWTTAEAGFSPVPLEEKAFRDKRARLLAELGEGGGFNAEFYGRRLKGKNIVFLLDNSGSMMIDNRIDRLKSELTAMIGGLTEPYRFGLVVFPSDNVPGRDFDRATEKYREKVLRFVDGMVPAGGTPMVGAIEYAYRRVVGKRNVDTLYLLSDGQPSDLDGRDLTNLILKHNEELGCTIHTIFIGEDDPEGRALMEQIAKDGGGKFFPVP